MTNTCTTCLSSWGGIAPTLNLVVGAINILWLAKNHREKTRMQQLPHLIRAAQNQLREQFIYDPNSLPTSGILRSLQEFRQGDLSSIEVVNAWISVTKNMISNTNRPQHFTIDALQLQLSQLERLNSLLREQCGDQKD